MGTRTWAFSWTFTVELESGGDDEDRRAHQTEGELRIAAEAAALARGAELGVRVEQQGGCTMALDDVEGVGRCVRCGDWVVHDGELWGLVPPGLSPGAIVDGRLLCDLCLPDDHPLHF